MSRLIVAENVGVGDRRDVVYAAPLPDGPIAVLDGIAAFIWDEALESEREIIASRVAAATGRPVAEIEAAVVRLHRRPDRAAALRAQRVGSLDRRQRPLGAPWHT